MSTTFAHAGHAVVEGLIFLPAGIAVVIAICRSLRARRRNPPKEVA